MSGYNAFSFSVIFEVSTVASSPSRTLRATITVPLDSEQDAVVAEAQKDPKVRKFTDGMEIVKVILVKNKLVNLIVRPKR